MSKQPCSCCHKMNPDPVGQAEAMFKARAALEQARLAYECHPFYARDFVGSGILHRGLCYTCHSFKNDPIHLKDGEQADARIKALKAVQ